MSDTAGRVVFALGATAGVVALWWLWKNKEGKKFGQHVATVVGLWVYPVKSCKGVELNTGHCGVRGLKYDRY